VLGGEPVHVDEPDDGVVVRGGLGDHHGEPTGHTLDETHAVPDDLDLVHGKASVGEGVDGPLGLDVGRIAGRRFPGRPH
jgi:hypothetical protein